MSRFWGSPELLMGRVSQITPWKKQDFGSLDHPSKLFSRLSDSFAGQKKQVLDFFGKTTQLRSVSVMTAASIRLSYAGYRNS
jgi:hypothetical protein